MHPLLTDPVGFLQPVGIKITDENSMGMDIPKFFMAGDLNSIVFKPEHSMGIEKITLYFVVGIRLINHFQREQILEYNFPLGTIFWPIFPVGRGSHRVCEKGVLLCFMFVLIPVCRKNYN